jgi:cation diffusion facilitator CzcD-associated flavoprotein CzcO
MASAEQVSDILCIGSGFGGLTLGIALRNAGIENFRLLERSPSPGGVWRDNTYPGCACDVPSRFYSYSFEQNWPWSSRFGQQKEIWDYFNHCMDKYKIRQHVCTKTSVKSARWDEEAALWTVETASGGQLRSRVLVSGTGLFNQPVYPDIRGRETFAGPAWHSSCWNHDVDIKGKRVAVIGTGASAIQFVPEVAKVAGKLLVCQRSPQYVNPKDMGIPFEERKWYMNTAPWHKYERYKIYKEMDSGIGRRYSHELANAAREKWLVYLEENVPDDVLRAKLTPVYPFGCKRMLQSNDWYPALQRPNVELVSTAVEEITATGIRLSDGIFHEVDAIIYGSGFKPTSFLPGLEIHGRNGVEIHQQWKDAAEAYLGITVENYPNFFMLYGPNTNAAASIIYMLEHQANYIVQCVQALNSQNAAAMAIRSDVFRSFNESVTMRLQESIVAAANCNSYFKLPSGRIPTQWPWTMTEYHARTVKVDTRQYIFTQKSAVNTQARELAEAAE